MTTNSRLTESQVRERIATGPYERSSHAQRRMAEMLLRVDEVTRAYREPVKAFYQRKYDVWCLSRGRVTLAVTFNDPTPALVTVLWATREGWEASYAAGHVKGRAPRDRIVTAL